MNSRTRNIWVWYLAVPEYKRCIIAETLPNIDAYMSATWKIEIEIENINSH